MGRIRYVDARHVGLRLAWRDLKVRSAGRASRLVDTVRVEQRCAVILQAVVYRAIPITN